MSWKKGSWVNMMAVTPTAIMTTNMKSNSEYATQRGPLRTPFAYSSGLTLRSFSIAGYKTKAAG